MRTEKQMLELIMGTAKNSERIRAVIMNGSKINPEAPKDIFQDYDILYVVSDIEHFTKDHSWIDLFGEIMIMQMPEDMIYPPPKKDGSFSYLMQFSDGNRLDLTLYQLSTIHQFKHESLSQVLLDKDLAFQYLESPSNKDHLPIKPSRKEFIDCCNEFWWVSTYVAKGLWRKEITYAKHIHEQVLREPLFKMLDWHIGDTTGYTVSSGKYGKYYSKLLSPEYWQMLKGSYSGSDIEEAWDALFVIANLFRKAAISVANANQFGYLKAEDEKVMAHLKYVRGLPSDALDMYPS
ncbi:aminoglycoside 6-adenylyltransferase [Vibrio maritimus]|uniref:aminoglycoside 6-adenylyltransferase n=1 Tax=Vibrio maritimus TaxID=990268 RepID=UPI001F307F1E|nr:aminoglycoside 6-adenylyltransferase [Vibrio maritimus]